jgi:hypothetical protein
MCVFSATTAAHTTIDRHHAPVTKRVISGPGCASISLGVPSAAHVLGGDELNRLRRRVSLDKGFPQIQQRARSVDAVARFSHVGRRALPVQHHHMSESVSACGHHPLEREAPDCLRMASSHRRSECELLATERDDRLTSEAGQAGAHCAGAERDDEMSYGWLHRVSRQCRVMSVC